MFEHPVKRTVISRISRRQDSVVTRFRDAARREGRDDLSRGVVLIDGVHLLLDALRAELPVDLVLATTAMLDTPTDEMDELWERAAAAGCTVHEVTAGVMAAASPVKTPTGVVALAQWAPAPLDTIWTTQPSLVIGLVDVQDPGNAGAAIRSADGLGATAVVMIGVTADPGSPKALRGAMGSTFRLPVTRASLADTIAAAKTAGLQVVATLSPGENTVDVHAADLTKPTLLLLGNEGAGLPTDALAAANLRVSVHMRSGINSFNVAVTAALMLYEARAQRGST